MSIRSAVRELQGVPSSVCEIGTYIRRGGAAVTHYIAHCKTAAEYRQLKHPMLPCHRRIGCGFAKRDEREGRATEAMALDGGVANLRVGWRNA